MKKIKTLKNQLNFIEIEGLIHSHAEIIEIEEDTVSDGYKAPTSDFKYMKLPYDFFNPMQSEILPHIATEDNIVLSSPTASGKTLVIEMLAAYAIYNNKKAIYVSPQKALSQEKLQDWSNIEHDFSQYNVGILTGDYQKTSAALNYLNSCGVIITTIEAFDSISRMANPAKEEHNWIYNTGALIIDEAHLISDKSRGSKLEASIIRFSEINTMARIALLSATMNNLQDIKKWLDSITNRNTVLHESKYRPCKLKRHYIKFKPKTTEKEAKKELTSWCLSQRESQNFLTFVGTKKYGHMLEKEINTLGIESKFFKADLSLEERMNLYNSFNDRQFRHLISTSALAAGLNMPARNTIVSDMSFGLNEQIPTTLLNQEVGRAGRPKYDDSGDSWIFIKESNWKRDFYRMQNGEPIISQMIDHNIIAFHILAGISNKEILCPIDLIKWYSKTLAKFQSRDMEIYEARDIFQRLERCGMINEMSDGTYSITQIGIITASYYLIPEDVVAWIKNFDELFRNKENFINEWQEDIAIAECMANIPTWKTAKIFASKEESEVSSSLFSYYIKNGIDKVALCYALALNNDKYFDACSIEPKARYFKITIDALRNDCERILSALSLIDIRAKKWRQSSFWQEVINRFKYGVGRDRLELCQLEGIGGSRSKDLFDNGIRTIRDVIRNEFKVREILGDKTADKAMASARGIMASLLEW